MSPFKDCIFFIALIPTLQAPEWPWILQFFSLPLICSMPNLTKISLIILEKLLCSNVNGWHTSDSRGLKILSVSFPPLITATSVKPGDIMYTVSTKFFCTQLMTPRGQLLSLGHTRTLAHRRCYDMLSSFLDLPISTTGHYANFTPWKNTWESMLNDHIDIILDLYRHKVDMTAHTLNKKTLHVI